MLSDWMCISTIWWENNGRVFTLLFCLHIGTRDGPPRSDLGEESFTHVIWLSCWAVLHSFTVGPCSTTLLAGIAFGLSRSVFCYVLQHPQQKQQKTVVCPVAQGLTFTRGFPIGTLLFCARFHCLCKSVVTLSLTTCTSVSRSFS